MQAATPGPLTHPKYLLNITGKRFIVQAVLDRVGGAATLIWDYFANLPQLVFIPSLQNVLPDSDFWNLFSFFW